MEDFNINISSQDISYDNRDTTYEVPRGFFVLYVVMWIIPCIGLPLILVAIYALYSQVRHDHVAPIYVINLLISDLIQLCCMMVWLPFFEPVQPVAIDRLVAIISMAIHMYCLIASIGFMVCVALERYLVIACPMWYRFRRTIKNTVVVCVVVWVFPLVVCLTSVVAFYIWGVFFLLPLPLFIFFLCGTVRALSASRVSSDEKRRIVGILVLVLLTYTLLFLPIIILHLSHGGIFNETLVVLSLVFVLFSPLADLVLYVFMRKGIIDKLLASMCCCRMDSDDINTYE